MNASSDIRTAGEVTPLTNTADAPARSTTGGGRYTDSLVTGGAANSHMSEAYRMLRTSLLLELGSDLDDEKLGVIVVTSAGRAEGKTTTCANLALVFGQMGRSVAIVDADLRLPNQHIVFDVEAIYGLDEAMRRASGDPARLSEVAVKVNDKVDLFLPGDFKPELPSEVIATTGFRTLLRELRERYDLVIVDTAPVGLVTDAALAAQRADGVLFVVSAEQKSRRVVKRAYSELEKAGVRVLGSVMNRHTPARPGRSDRSNDYFSGGAYFGDPGARLRDEGKANGLADR